MTIGMFMLMFFIMILLNIPIVYCMFIPSLVFLYTNGIPLNVIPQRMIAGVDSFSLLAVPLFVLAGAVMNSSGITDRIFYFAQKMLGHLTGGLGYANVAASVIFAGMSGSAIADAGGLGAVEVQAMKQHGYDEDFSLAVTGASSIIGPIIPPSIPAIIFAVSAEVSVGRLFVAGVVPGLLMACTMCFLVYMTCRKRNYVKDKRASAGEKWQAFKRAFFPLMTPVIILAGTFSGVFTPTETASATVVYSLILGFAYRSIGIREIPGVLMDTARTTVSVMTIVSASALFSWVLTYAKFPEVMAAAFTGFVTSKALALIVINVLLLIVGTFMDNSAAIPILAPVLLPIAVSYGVDPIHFGIIMILNLMIGLLTPPVGMVLYVLVGMSDVPMEKIVKCMLPFILILSALLLVITFVPGISMALPTLFFK
ncbi:TRAP transporter large permease [[Clostridium] symbiosum]|uniref:TRAP transporter large permease n=1 Tax=Clostridium symbiosum TaxID=1512 RepID=UPI001D0623BB|nr:TRAP transporter large permease [[Clostridium] symbiosum]MCB6611393.1 TRAP transporter large permease [[Clostridium] symbiosum]MCB6932270.1 TRAP transporter large permease [[Clostridium] symbiosum]